MKLKNLLLILLALPLQLLQGSQHPDFHDYMKQLLNTDVKWAAFLNELHKQATICSLRAYGINIKNYILRFRDKFDELYNKIQNHEEKEGEFTEFMGQILTIDDWFALLRDIDTLEKDCSSGFMGSYHVDVPNLAGLPPLSQAEANFHLQKAKLYQGYGSDGWKGPFSTYMSALMKSENWMKFFLHYQQQKEFCRDFLGRLGKNTTITDGDYIPKALDYTDSIRQSITQYFTKASEALKNGTRPSPKLGNYVNSVVTDHKWAQIIQELTEFESVCNEELMGRKLFLHFSWPFLAGVSKDPFLSYQMSDMISKYLIKLGF